MKISFYANRTQFDGDALEKRGLGGSESALINLSRALNESLSPNDEITVYNGQRKKEEYNGITYKSHNDFLIDCKNFNQDVFISLRDHAPFFVPYIDSKIKILWSQDDLNERGLQDLQNRIYPRENVDFFLAISEYAKGEIQKGFPEKKVFLQRNGYNDKLISKEVFYKPRSPIAVYSSTPYRGLDVLTEVWPIIFNECSKNGISPKLKVFSGMELYGWSNSPFQPMYEVLRRMEDIGVQLVGPIPQTNLYRELQYCKVMTYPNHFLETGCMSCTEAIACGVWIISTNLGALNEQVQNGYNGYLIEGNAHSPQYKAEFIDRSVDALCSDSLPINDCSTLVLSWKEQANNLLKIIRKENPY